MLARCSSVRLDLAIIVSSLYTRDDFGLAGHSTLFWHCWPLATILALLATRHCFGIAGHLRRLATRHDFGHFSENLVEVLERQYYGTPMFMADQVASIFGLGHSHQLLEF